MPRPGSHKEVPFLAEGVSNPIIPKKAWTRHESNPMEAKVALDACVAWIPRNVNEWTDLIHKHELGHIWATEVLTSPFGETEPGIWDHMLREPQVNILLLRQVGWDVARAMRAMDFADHPVPLLARDAGLLWINIAYYLKDADHPNLREFAARLEAVIRGGWEGDKAFQTIFDAVAAVIKDPSNATRNLWAVKCAEYFNPPPPAPTLKGELSDETSADIREADEAEWAEKDAEREKIGDEIAKALGQGSVLENMEIHQHITMVRPGRRIANTRAVRDTGMVPDRFDRFCTDQMIFSIKKTGGSLLIDCSGSMHWDWNALREGLKGFPNVTVGCYQGFSDDAKGRLCVIAKKGRWSDYVPRREPGGLCGNNTVDIQALTWLAQQPKPRLWLSDGRVCGGTRTNTPHDIDPLLRKNQILRVHDLTTALRYFGRKEIAAFTQCNGGPVVARRK